MVRMHWLLLGMMVLTGSLLLPGPATAGPFWDWLCGCPPPEYCPGRYWAPTLARAYDCLKGPHLSVYPPDRHPEVPPTVTVLKYRCKPVLPEATLFPVPLPPEESRFQYFERPGTSGSSATGSKQQNGESSDKREP